MCLKLDGQLVDNQGQEQMFQYKIKPREGGTKRIKTVVPEDRDMGISDREFKVRIIERLTQLDCKVSEGGA